MHKKYNYNTFAAIILIETTLHNVYTHLKMEYNLNDNVYCKQNFDYIKPYIKKGVVFILYCIRSYFIVFLPMVIFICEDGVCRLYYLGYETLLFYFVVKLKFIYVASYSNHIIHIIIIIIIITHEQTLFALKNIIIIMLSTWRLQKKTEINE